MKDLNKAMIIGNLTRDPEVRALTTGQAVASFAVATNRRWKSNDGEMKDSAEFHDVVAWGKLAEIVEKILKKGRRVYIEGRLQTRSWEGQDGIKRYKTEIVASDVNVLDRKPEDADIDMVEEADESSRANNQESEDDKKEEKEEDVDLDDIPF